MEANQAAIENAREVEQTRTLAAVEERQRLARELHDSAAQSLYSLTLLVEASRRNIASGDIEKVRDQITRLGEMAQQTLKEMRLLVYQLRPMELETDNLVDAIRHRLNAVEKRSGVNAQLHVNLDAILPAGMENDLFRIAQEALNNALKHAEATVITVTLNAGSQFVELEILDNGKGFDPQEIDGQGGMGMGNIRERTQTLGGQFTISSQPGSGTRVWVRVPIHEPAIKFCGGSNDS
jgi:signal transduction histidine kinase